MKHGFVPGIVAKMLFKVSWNFHIVHSWTMCNMFWSKGPVLIISTQFLFKNHRSGFDVTYFNSVLPIPNYSDGVYSEKTKLRITMGFGGPPPTLIVKIIGKADFLPSSFEEIKCPTSHSDFLRRDCRSSVW